MRVLLTGATGQLGKAIKFLKPKEITLIETSRNDLNLISEDQCFKKIKHYKPDWIINSAAFTNVELAEKNFKEAYQVNALGPKNFADSIKKYGGKLLQISTDYVFDGSQNIPYKTGDQTNPLNNYGLSKEVGEKNIIKILGESNSAIILRSSWVISQNENNFLTKILNLIFSKREINVVSDQISCPTSSITLARMCWQILKEEKSIFNLYDNHLPIFHCSDQGIASWYDIALSIYKNAIKMGLIKNECLIKPVKSNEYYSLAKRPLFSLLDCKSSFQFLNFRANHWKDELYEIMSKMVY